MEQLKKHSETLLQDIRYVLFRRFTIISAFYSFGFMFIHIINKRPPANIITAALSGVISYLAFYTSKNERNYLFSRLLMFIYFTFFMVPLGYITSPGSMSAMIYTVFLIIIVLSMIAVNRWEYLFSFTIVIELILLLRTEVWFPDLYYKYTDVTYRINDLTINITFILIAIIILIRFMMNHYSLRFNNLYELSNTDSLTKLYNRRYFFHHVEIEVKRAIRNKKAYTLVFIDLNNFKKINDQYGHLKGDEVLIEIARILKDNVRPYDIAARYGGDEFIVFLPETDHVSATSYINRLKTSFNEITNQYQEVLFSVGIGYESSSTLQIDEIIAIADEKLYENKKSHKRN